MEEPIRILCVDDEINILKSLRRLFLDNDYEIVNASSGPEGLHLLESGGPFQIVISDFRMPEMNGVDFLTEVFRKCPDTIRIVLSGFADTSSMVAAINQAQIFKFIPKPWDDDELKATIECGVRRYLQNRQQREVTAKLIKRIELLCNDCHDNGSVASSASADQESKMAEHILDVLPMAVIAVNSAGRIILCNRQGVSLLGIFDELPERDGTRGMLPSELHAVMATLAEKNPIACRTPLHDSWAIVAGIVTHYENQELQLMVVERELCHE